MKKVVMVSGGIDSTVLAAKLKKDGHEIHAVTAAYCYGDVHNHEVDFAKANMLALGIPHTVVELSEFSVIDGDVPLWLMAGGSANGCDDTGGSGGPTPQPPKPKRKPGQEESWQRLPLSVPIMHMTGLMYALRHGAEEVCWALHSDDLLPSEVPQHLAYAHHMEEVVALMSGRRVTLSLPFINMTKAEVVALGLELGVDVENTYSCSAPGDKPCGGCAQCRLREKAMMVNLAEVS